MIRQWCSKNKVHTKPLRLQTILFVFLLIMELCVILLIEMCTIQIFSNSMVNQLATSRIDLLKQISGRLDSLSSIMISFSDLYYYNEPIHSLFLDSEKPDHTILSQQLDGFNKQYEKALVTNGLPLEYSIVAKDFSYHPYRKYTSARMEDYNVALWRYDFLKSKDDIAWIPTYQDVWSDQPDLRVFSYARGLSDLDGNKAAYFLVSVSESVLYNTYEETLTQNNSIYIINNDGRIVSHSDSNMVGFYFYRMNRLEQLFNGNQYTVISKNGEEYLLAKAYNKVFGWTILEEIPMSIVLQPLNQIKVTMILIGAALFIIGGLLAYHLAHTISTPLKQLCMSLKKIATSERGNVQFNFSSWQELGEISDECNYMSNRIDSLVKNIKKKEKQNRETELRFLYAQINPHFMHNTLFSLKCLIAMKQNKEAENMLSEFSALLGILLQSSEQLIPIEQELYILNRYIMVQKFQYGEQFSIKINCVEEDLNYLVPKLLLQPLIENSIFHGFSSGCTDGLIEINVQPHGEQLHIDIKDNGMGFDTRVLNLNDTPEDSAAEPSAHIGVKNVHNRIRLIFGKKYGLRIYSEVGKGTCITVCLPKKLDNNSKGEE